MSSVEYDLEGRVSVGRTRHGDQRKLYLLELNGRDVYQLQRLLEEMAVRSEDFLEVRELVLLSEHLREAVVKSEGRGQPGGTDGGR